jgi:hypothetical protein
VLERIKSVKRYNALAVVLHLQITATTYCAMAVYSSSMGLNKRKTIFSMASNKSEAAQ